MSEGRDPLGKRALFEGLSAPPPPAGREEPEPPRRRLPTLRRTRVVSPPSAAGEEVRRPAVQAGCLSVECSACAARTQIGLIDFAIYQLPVGLWLPRGRFDHRMTCPACRRRTWLSVSLRR